MSRFGRDVYRCAACGHITVPAGVARGASGLTIYEEPSSVFLADGNEDYYLDESSTVAARDKVKLVTRFACGGRLLDVGSGFGHFLAAARDAFDVEGVELSPQAVEWARRELHVRSHVGSIFDLPPAVQRAYDVVTSWDVIEHVENPRVAVRRLRDRIVPGGWLFLSTPDAGAAIARVMGARWHYLDPVQHVNLFSRSNLSKLLEQEGFQVRKTTHLGRPYRVSYITSRLVYLGRSNVAARLAAGVLRVLPARTQQAHVRIKLWDVMALAAVRALD